MEILSTILAFFKKINRTPVVYPQRVQVMRGLDFFIVFENQQLNRRWFEPTWYPCVVMCYQATTHTMRCRYSAVNFLQNPHKIHPIDHPLGRDIGRSLWFDTTIYILLQPTQCFMKYCDILGRVITAPDWFSLGGGGGGYLHGLTSIPAC